VIYPISLGSGPFHEGKQYYFKYIHERNQSYFQRASIDIKSSKFVPYEAGRKIPINERVQYYMEKLTAEEEEAQRIKDEQLGTDRRPSSHRKNHAKRDESYDDLAELTDHDISTVSDHQASIHKFKGAASPGRESPKRGQTLLPSLIRNSGSNFNPDGDGIISLRTSKEGAHTG
jgi:hypothetical protein